VPYTFFSPERFSLTGERICNERKLKRAADLIYEDLRMLRWDEVKK
jgi:hypothetical protein